MDEGQTGNAAVAVEPEDGLEGADAELARQALDVLAENWIGHATKPSPRLYPHQWSWDSACHAIGYARFDQDRAEQELLSLFRGQWRNGMLPHIVFTDGEQYFPGPEFWQTDRSPDAPEQPMTSGIVQPPIHATAALHVYRVGKDRQRAAAFASVMLPKLGAWHDYIYRERTRGDALAEVWHPWETGMDNSPLWDEPLARIELLPEDVPSYRRVDTELAAASERPTSADYDRYAYLVRVFREHDYDAAAIREASPFVVQAVIFNSLLVQSNRDLAELARAVGDDPAPHEARAEATAATMNEQLWDDTFALYGDRDVRADEHLTTLTAGSFTPLYAGVPSPERAERLIAQHLDDAGVAVAEREWAIASLPPGDPRFEPTLYWRGPIWPIMNWFLYRGLVRYGHLDLARRVRATLVELPRRSGFWEHYSPVNGGGHGGERFSWTAALVLDALLDQSSNAPAGSRAGR